ncbi:MAG: hypothetical protein WCF78_04395 [archaeon]
MNKRLVIDIGRRGNRKLVSEHKITKHWPGTDNKLILARDSKTKKAIDYYIHLLNRDQIHKLITRDSLKIIKNNPELMQVLQDHIFHKLSGQKILETKNARFIINDFKNSYKEQGKRHDKIYDLIYFDKIKNITHRFFIKRERTYMLNKSERADSQFTGIKLLEAEGFNIIKPYFGIFDPINKVSAIAYEYTNLEPLAFALDNGSITKDEYQKICNTLHKVESLIENKMNLIDINNSGNVFVERIRENKIKLYITDVMNDNVYN